MPTYNYSLSDLTNDVMTNLYLYGVPETPEDLTERVRPDAASPVVVTLDMADFMTNGPGRYAFASNATFVQDFFAGNYNAFISGSYTVSQLKSQFSISEEAFRFVMQQYAVDPASTDYQTRSYIFNTDSFAIKDDTVFVFDGANSHIEDLHIRAFDDNFNFSLAARLQQRAISSSSTHLLIHLGSAIRSQST